MTASETLICTDPKITKHLLVVKGALGIYTQSYKQSNRQNSTK